MKSLNNLKFKRIIEKHGNKITYVESTIGISYALYLSGVVKHHSLQYYIVTNSKPEHWHRKANDLESVLNAIAQQSPAFAERIFYNSNECVGCRTSCMAPTLYTFQGQKKTTCAGNVFFKMCLSDFSDVCSFFAAVSELAVQKEVAL